MSAHAFVGIVRSVRIEGREVYVVFSVESSLTWSTYGAATERTQRQNYIDWAGLRRRVDAGLDESSPGVAIANVRTGEIGSYLIKELVQQDKEVRLRLVALDARHGLVYLSIGLGEKCVIYVDPPTSLECQS